MVSKIKCYLTGLIEYMYVFAAKDILSLIFETDRHSVYREWSGQSGFGQTTFVSKHMHTTISVMSVFDLSTPSSC